MDLTVVKDFWERVKETEKPIVLYGTGNGADRVIDEFEERGIKLCAVFASDGFVRDRSFRGFKVISYSDAKARFGSMLVILGFGTHDKDVIENIKRIARDDELLMPDMLQDELGNIFDRAYFNAHIKDIEYAYSILADERSRKNFEDIIRYRLSGDIKYLLEDQESEIESWKLLNFRPCESFVDCGAYNGDTISRFLSFAPRYEHIYAFEPDKKTFKKLEKNTAGLENIELFNTAVSDKAETLYFDIGKGRGSKLGGKVEIPTLTLDSTVKEATILKFDTEGFEEKALNGGCELIKRCHPRMVLSAYHKIDDLWRLPRTVQEIDPSYKFYLRKAIAIPYWDSNLYLV